MHENMKVSGLSSDLLKSTLATCIFFFRIISKQEIRIVALKQRPQISELVGKFVHAEKEKDKRKHSASVQICLNPFFLISICLSVNRVKIKWKTMKEWKYRSSKSLRICFCILSGAFCRSSNISAWKYQKSKWHATFWHCRLAGGELLTGRLPQCWCKLRNRSRHDDIVCVFSGSTLVQRMKLSSAAPSMITFVLVVNPLHDSIKIL